MRSIYFYYNKIFIRFFWIRLSVKNEKIKASNAEKDPEKKKAIDGAIEGNVGYSFGLKKWPNLFLFIYLFFALFVHIY